MIEYTQIQNTVYALTEEGNQIAASGSHEFRVWNALPPKGTGAPVSIPDLKVSLLLQHDLWQVEHDRLSRYIC